MQATSSAISAWFLPPYLQISDQQVKKKLFGTKPSYFGKAESQETIIGVLTTQTSEISKPDKRSFDNPPFW